MNIYRLFTWTCTQNNRLTYSSPNYEMLAYNSRYLAKSEHLNPHEQYQLTIYSIIK